MILHPHNGTVLCKMINQKDHLANEKGIVYNKEELPIYEIVELGELSDKYDFKVGDKIASNSIPAKLKTDDDTYYLIRQEYIAGKVI